VALRKFLLSTTILVGIAVAVGFVVSGDDGFDWWLTAGLVALAVCGEGLRTWINAGRAKRRTPTAG
jgi:hypothetical protein